MVKNLILCFRHEALIDGKLTPTFCGMGDIIRGFIHCFLLCEALGIKFHINFNDHSLKKFINTSCFNFNDSIPDEIIFVEGSELNSLVHNATEKNLYLMTNGDFSLKFPTKESLSTAFESIFLSDGDILHFVKSNFNFSGKIFHARFGDGMMVDSKFIDDFYSSHPFSPSSWFKIVPDSSKYEIVFDSFKDSISSFDFVSSDHLDFKYFLKNKIDIDFIDSRPCHLGMPNLNQDDIFYTLCDFYLIYHSKKVVSVGSYPFGKRPSGFSFWSYFFNKKNYSFYSFEPFRSEVKALEI
tara:strand:+ start:807 stop:1694 length:888 start_codon:yes stop_codon:yes gene_type:complete